MLITRTDNTKKMSHETGYHKYQQLFLNYSHDHSTYKQSLTRKIKA